MWWSTNYVRILKAIRCVKIDMDNPRDMEASGPFEARYLAFLETITQLRPRLHRYCSRMTGSVMDGEDVVQDALFELTGSWSSTMTAALLVRGCSGLRTIGASTGYGGVECGLRRKLLPWVRITSCLPILRCLELAER